MKKKKKKFWKDRILIEETLKQTSSIPTHIGIIMDGNGRWAKNKGLSRTEGHKEGLEAAKRVILRASQIGIKWVTLYTFSTENWKRTVEEVGFLMSLIKKHLRSEYDFYKQNRIRIQHCGDLSKMPQDIQKEIILAENETKNFNDMTVVLALNYGSRDEIVRAIKKILPDEISSITEESFSSILDSSNIPDPDLIIRTGGEKRLSNFLLWQAAYSELFFSDILWPDWNEETLDIAINDYQKRDRRFGGIKICI